MSCNCKGKCTCKTACVPCPTPYKLEDCGSPIVNRPAIPLVQQANVPACDVTADFYIDPVAHDLRNLPTGSYLVNGDYGWFEVIGFDCETGIVKARNNCKIKSAALPGAPIEVGTTFIIASFPEMEVHTDINSTRTYLCTDIAIPSVGKTLVVKLARGGVASNFDAFSNQIVRFEGYPFLVKGLIGYDRIEIENTSADNPVGHYIEAGDTCDRIIADFSSVDSPCSKASIKKGAVVVCDNEGDLKTIQAVRENMVLVSTDDGKFELKDVPQLEECLSLGNCLLLVPGVDYSEDGVGISLQTSTPFFTALGEDAINFKITIRGYPFRIKQVISPTTLVIEPAFVVSENIELNPWDPVCVEECCNQCDNLNCFGSIREQYKKIIIGDIKELPAPTEDDDSPAAKKRYYGPDTLFSGSVGNTGSCDRMFKVTVNIKSPMRVNVTYSGGDDLSYYISAMYDYHLTFIKNDLELDKLPSPAAGNRFTHAAYEVDTVTAHRYPSGFLGNGFDQRRFEDGSAERYFFTQALMWGSGDVSEWIFLRPGESATYKLVFRAGYQFNPAMDLADIATNGNNIGVTWDYLIECKEVRNLNIPDED